jgi:hypothetical protein
MDFHRFSKVFGFGMMSVSLHRHQIGIR